MPGRPFPATKEACSGSIALEWIDDTGAGRHLSSIKHIARYFGVSPETVLKWAHAPSENISFYTGGGSDKKAKLALTIISKVWGRGELRLLDDCPEVRSSGMIVEDLDRPRIHWPGDAPYYVRDKAHCQVVCPEWNRIYPVKVEENVPIFADEVVYTNPGPVHALPAPPVDEAPGGEPPAPAAPPLADGEGAGIAVAPPPPPPPPPAHLDSLIERKRKEATSAEHLRTHFPKNPFCEWCQRGRVTSPRMRRRRQDPDVLPEQPLPAKVGERISTNTYMVAKSAADEVKVAHGGEYCAQTCRDSFSVVSVSLKIQQRTTENIGAVLLHFSPNRPGEATVCKGDNAKEAMGAVKGLGWIPDPSLENRFPHNSAHERDPRT